MATRADVWFIDMDKTAILPYSSSIPTSWDMMNQVAGLGKVGQRLWEKYHPHPEQYEEWVQELASYYYGREAKPIQDEVIAATTIRSGLTEMIHYVKVQNPRAQQGIISAGLEFVAGYVAGQVGLDFYKGIELKVGDDGKFTGDAVIHVRETDKVTAAKQYLHGTPWKKAAHIGDGRSDISLWKQVGHAFGIGVGEEYRSHVAHNFEGFRDLQQHLQQTGNPTLKRKREMF